MAVFTLPTLCIWSCGRLSYLHATESYVTACSTFLSIGVQLRLEYTLASMTLKVLDEGYRPDTLVGSTFSSLVSPAAQRLSWRISASRAKTPSIFSHARAQASGEVWISHSSMLLAGKLHEEHGLEGSC